MDRSKLKATFSKNQETLAELRTEIEGLSGGIKLLNDQKDAKSRILGALSSKDAVVDALVKMDGDERDRLFIGNILHSAARGKDPYETAESINNSLEVLREFMTSGEPFVVMTTCTDEAKVGRSRLLLYAGDGMATNPVVHDVDGDFVLGDMGDETKKLALTQNRSRFYSDSNFGLFNEGLGSGNVLIFKGHDEISGMYDGLKSIDQVALLIVATSLDGITDFPHIIEVDEYFQIRDALAQCIAHASLKGAQFISNSHTHIKDSVMYKFENIKLPDEVAKYAEVAQRMEKDADFREKLAKVFGEDFSYEAIRDRAREIVKQTTEQLFNLRTNLGVLAINLAESDPENTPQLRF